MRIVALLLALTTGCSWMSSRPVRHHSNGSIDCSTSRGAAGVDTVMAVGTGLGALAALADEPAAGLVVGTVAALYIASAVHGYKQAGQCQRAIEGLAMRPDSDEDLVRSHWVAPSLPVAESSESSDSEETTEEEPRAAKVKVKAEIDASELEPQR